MCWLGPVAKQPAGTPGSHCTQQRNSPTHSPSEIAECCLYGSCNSAGRQIKLHLDRARPAVLPASRLYAKIRKVTAGGDFIFSVQVWEWYQPSHYLSSKADKSNSVLWVLLCMFHTSSACMERVMNHAKSKLRCQPNRLYSYSLKSAMVAFCFFGPLFVQTGIFLVMNVLV